MTTLRFMAKKEGIFLVLAAGAETYKMKIQPNHDYLNESRSDGSKDVDMDIEDPEEDAHKQIRTIHCRMPFDHDKELDRSGEVQDMDDGDQMLNKRAIKELLPTASGEERER